MRCAFTTTLLLAAAGAALAQNRPQLTWQGYVTGSATLYIQGDRVDVQGRNTGAIDRPSYHFTSALPAERQRVDLQVRRGRGRVDIAEQPTPGNQYTAIVQIDPPGQRAEFYSIDFFWDRGGQQSRYDRRDRNDRYNDGDRWQTRARQADSYQGGGELRWSGRVDGEALIEVRGNRAYSRTVKGRPVVAENLNITSPMPRANGGVQLTDVSGRGNVELVQQPDASNGYAAVVRIRDEEGGAGPYSFRLVWDDPGGVRSRSDYRNSGYGINSARWSGRVDGKIVVSMQGNRATVTTISGAPVAGMNADFSNPVPSNASDVQIRKLQGRGDVRLVRGNNGTLAFEIDDDDGGPDFYEIEITWR